MPSPVTRSSIQPQSRIERKRRRGTATWQNQLRLTVRCWRLLRAWMRYERAVNGSSMSAVLSAAAREKLPALRRAAIGKGMSRERLDELEHGKPRAVPRKTAPPSNTLHRD